MEIANREEVTSASMSMSLGQGITVAAAVMTTGGNADSALANVLDRVVPAPTSRWAAMVEEAPPAVRIGPLPPPPPPCSHPVSPSPLVATPMHALVFQSLKKVNLLWVPYPMPPPLQRLLQALQLLCQKKLYLS